MADQLTKILVAYRRQPPILDYLERAFAARDIELIKFDLDENTWFDKWVINRVNKQLHNLRILPKSKSLFESHPLAHRNYLNAKLWSVYQEQSPDAVLLIRDTIFGHESLKKMSCIKLGWWIESENRVQEVIDEMELFDWYFCMNNRCVESLNEAGYFKTSYMQHAVDTTKFYPIDRVVKKYDLCFVGTYSEARQKMIEAALDVTTNIVIYGPRWKERCRFNRKIMAVWQGPSIRGAELNSVYNESKVVLNVTGWDASEGSRKSGMNMRLFEVPATGSCLLTDEILELDQHFSIGDDVLVYRNIGDFKEMLTKCLNQPEWREAIARSGLSIVRQKYTYDQTARAIVERVKVLRAQKS